jgi:hypothetical protein
MVRFKSSSKKYFYSDSLSPKASVLSYFNHKLCTLLAQMKFNSLNQFLKSNRNHAKAIHNEKKKETLLQLFLFFLNMYPTFTFIESL